MICPDFSEKSLRALLEAIKDRCCLFPSNHRLEFSAGPLTPIYLRFDIDDNMLKALRMAEICFQYGINATFFILNTARYWNDITVWGQMEHMQNNLEQEIGWHNNILTEFMNQKLMIGEELNIGEKWIGKVADFILSEFRDNGIHIRGSASHGDPLCHKLNYLNYEVFKECPRTQEAVNFPPCKFTIPQVSMYDFGLEYEAYHVHYDLYLSESGGRIWNRPFDKKLLEQHDRIQILIHPQHWKI